MSDDVTITVRVNNQTQAGFRDINGQLRTLDGRYAATSDSVRRSSSQMERGMVDLRATMLSLAPAAVPVAASLAPIAVHAGAAGVAVAAFGAAVVPQIGNLKSAADAQDKYTQAVTKYGQYSSQAVQAQAVVADTLAGVPKATQQAAAAYSNLRDEFHQFSDESAKFTMAPVEKSFAVMGALLPKLTPMAQGAAAQLDRLMTVAGGEVNSAGFDALSKKVSDFANNSLKSATDGAIHFIRVLSEGNSSGPLQQFFAYAKEQGPAVKDTLENLAKAVGNILQGAAQAGPGLLTLVDAFAKLVAAAPPQLIGTLMSVYSAFKLIKLAGAGMGAIAGGFQSLAEKITALRAASTAAGGGLAGLRAAFASLGTAAKGTVIVAAIAAVVAVLSKLSDSGRKAPDVDRMTTAIGNLGSTGKVTGEALRVFGSNLDGLSKSVDRVAGKASGMDKFNDVMNKIFTLGMAKSNSMKEAEQDVDALDKSLANLVQNGHADIAAQAVKDLQAAYAKKGGDPKKLAGELDDYKSALADSALEQKLAAQSMGLFGDAAQATQQKLDAQKLSADGLRQSIQALNDANRSALGGMIGFEQSIADAAKAAQTNAGALTMHNGQLDLSSQKARDAASALNDLAAKTDEAAADARQNGSSWEKVNSIYDQGRAALIKNAEAMGLSKDQAAALASQILKIPDKTAKVKMNAEDAIADLDAFNAAVKRAPGSKSVTLKTLSGAAEQVLEAFGYKVTHLKNGSVKVTAATGQALSAIGNVQGAVNSLHGKTITVMINGVATGVNPSQYYSQGPHARGGPVRGYAVGGEVQAFPDGGYVRGPGSGTSDSITAVSPGGAYQVSNTEYVIRSASVKKYGVGFLDAVNSGRLKLAGYASGGLTQAERDARGRLSSSMGISYFGRLAGYQRTPLEHSLGAPTDINALVSSLNDLSGQIKAAFSGKTESSLLKQLDKAGKSLINYDKQLNKVTASLDTAKSKLNDLKNSASQLSDSVKSNILSSANITQGASGGTVTVASIMGSLTASRDKATAFASALKGLQSEGLDKGLIQQIAEAGINGGGLETAGALLGASSSEISSINSLQGQINSAAGSAGKTTADAVYGAAIKAQDKLVKSLEKQQDKLEKAMANLAKVMEKAISKAVGKKASGGIVGAAASGGVRGGLTWVGENEPELLELPVGSRVWSGPDSRRMAGAAAGGVSRVELEIRSSGNAADELLLKWLRQAIRVRGGNVQLVLAGRPA